MPVQVHPAVQATPLYLHYLPRFNPFILVIIVILLRAFYFRYFSPLRSLPGPLLASFSRLWKVLSTARGQTHIDHINLHRHYGPVVRIAPDEVSISSPQAARIVLSAGKGFYKTDFYSVFPPPENPDIFTEIREDVHAVKRRVANVPYSMAAMRQLGPFIDSTIDLLIQRLGEFCVQQERGNEERLGNTKKGKVDLGAWLHYFAFDVLGEVAFSRSFGFLAAGKDVEDAIKTIDSSQTYNGIIGQVPELDFFLRRNPIWKLVPYLDPGNALITRIALEELAKRKPFNKDKIEEEMDGDKRRDLLGSLINGHLNAGSSFSEGDVFAVAHGAIFAGSDSTASTMQSFFHYILSVPNVYTRLQDELSDAISTNKVSKYGNIEYNQAQHLQYFQACLKETMRLRPAVGLNITRHVPVGGMELSGVFFKEGTRVALNAWVLHRDTNVFGENADEFWPERWLEDEQKARTMGRFMFQFGGGAHVCIGRNLALIEINKVIPRLLRDFKFELIYPGRELKTHASFFVVQEGLEVFVGRR